MRWIRPGIVILLSLAMTIGFREGKISAEVFAPFATGLIVYWLKSRDDVKKNGGG